MAPRIRASAGMTKATALRYPSARLRLPGAARHAQGRVSPDSSWLRSFAQRGETLFDLRDQRGALAAFVVVIGRGCVNVGAAVRTDCLLRLDIAIARSAQMQPRRDAALARNQGRAPVCPWPWLRRAGRNDRAIGHAFGDNLEFADGEGRLGGIANFSDALAQAQLVGVRERDNDSTGCSPARREASARSRCSRRDKRRRNNRCGRNPTDPRPSAAGRNEFPGCCARYPRASGRGRCRRRSRRWRATDIPSQCRRPPRR